MAKDKKKKQVVEEPPPVVEEPPPKTQEEIEEEWYETIKAAQNNEEKMKIILDSLNIKDYDGNARTTIYMDYVFYMFKFAEEQHYTNKQILALYHMTRDVLDQLKLATEENPVTSESSYEYFKSILMSLTLSKENNPPLFTISQSETIIDYMILSLYQHFLLYYSIFNMEQTNHNQEMNITVETPFYIPPLSEFHDSSELFPQSQLSADPSQLSLEEQQQQQQQQLSQQQSESLLSQSTGTTNTATASTANMSVNPSLHEGIGTTSNPPSTVEQTATTATTDTTTTTTTTDPSTSTTDPSTSTTDPSTSTTDPSTSTTDPSTSTTDPSTTATEQNTTSSASFAGKSTSTTNLTSSTNDMNSSSTVKE